MFFKWAAAIEITFTVFFGESLSDVPFLKVARFIPLVLKENAVAKMAQDLYNVVQ